MDYDALLRSLGLDNPQAINMPSERILSALWGALPDNVRKTYASAPEGVASLYNDFSMPGAIRETVGALGDTAKSAVAGEGWDTATNLAKALGAAVGVVPGGKLAVQGGKKLAQEGRGLFAPIKAYHGSPHDFDKFDASKIGTGEGAQAYGHGLYFAENEGVAKSYKMAGNYAARELDIINGQLTRISRELDQYRGGQWDKFTDPKGYDLKAQYDALLQKRSDLGRMYEVGIHEDPAKFLDWDKPLSGQTENVRDVLNKNWLAHPDAHARDTGEQIYRNNTPGFVSSGSYKEPLHEKASEILRDAGIPGIRYLDQGSRGVSGGELIAVNQTPDGFRSRVRVENRAGTGFNTPTTMFTDSPPFKTEAEATQWANEKIRGGTSNYVVFPGNEGIIEILRKYGLLPVAAGGAAAATVPGLLEDENAIPRGLLGPQPKDARQHGLLGAM